MAHRDDSMTDQPDPANPLAHEMAVPADTAAELAGILDRYMADLQAGKLPAAPSCSPPTPRSPRNLKRVSPASSLFTERPDRLLSMSRSVLGEFQIVRELGRGGMGVVYEAEQTSLHRRVALKVLRFGAVADHEAMRRFRREAETVARLHHTNIVPIFAVGCERDVHYYAMQFIEGRSLAEVLVEALTSPQAALAQGCRRLGSSGGRSADTRSPARSDPPRCQTIELATR